MVANNQQREPLPTSFRCVFCSNESSVSVKIDKKAGVGLLSCKSCGQNFQTGINCVLQHRNTRNYALTLLHRPDATCRCLLGLDRRLRRCCARHSIRCTRSPTFATPASSQLQRLLARRSSSRREVYRRGCKLHRGRRGGRGG